MMHIYSKVQRHAYLCVLAVWLVVLTANFALAQQAYDQGVIRIKVSEELARQLETSFMNRDANNVLVTGIQSIDATNIKYRVSAIKRVFRHAGKFEEKHRRYGLHRWYEIRMDQAAPVMQALADFGGIEHVELAEPSFKKRIIGSDNPNFGPVIVPEKKANTFVGLSGPANDPMLGDQWHYNNTGQQGGTPGSDIDLFQAWGLETGTPNVIVAVTDGGAQVNHPDLAPNMWVNTGEIPGNGLDDDNNGFVDDINGYGFGDDTGDIFPDDHGTHTSGTVAAVTNNGVGVAGVAGGSGAGDGARIMTLAAFGGFGTGGFAESYIYGADNGAVISQNSWGYTNPNVFEQAVLDGIDYFIAEAGLDENGVQVGPMRGGIVIFAAGNDDMDAAWYPGFYEPTLAVGALTNQDKKAWYSNFGTWVDMSAPGGETFFANDPHGVLSTVANNQYAFFQGTSMACPHVSGVAALIISKFGGAGFTPEMLRGRLVNLVDDVDAADPDFAGLLGTGRLNAFKALQEDDGDAPNVITDLASSNVTITSVTLTWTSPADPGNGSASVYDLRYATFPITSANFETATQVTGVPAPQVAGSGESFTVTGLSGGVTYYFAIKSADFFGNFSDISNVVEQATNFPPIAGVSPASLNASLETAETTTVALTIYNTGLGPLTFSFAAIPSNAFATPTPSSGTVAGESSTVVDVLLDASGRLPGTYTQNLVINTNDPATPTITVPVTLEVISNGQPIASVDPTSLDFGQLFESAAATLTLTVHNAGAVALEVTNVQSSNAKFTTDFASPVTIDPFEDFEINVTFSPGELGVANGTIDITTNDPDNTTLTVDVTGEGVPAPDIVVSPTSLSSSLNSDRTETQSLTISNTGGSNLNFTVEVSGAAAASVATSRTITIPVSGDASQNMGNQKTTGGNNNFSNQVQIRSVAQSAAVSNVLIISPDDNVTDVEVILDSFEDVEADVFPKASLPSITLADLEGYDIVLTTNNTQWLGSGGLDPGTIGDLLADYIDAGGKVISNQFAYSYDAWRMEGRFIDEQYGPFTPSTTDANITVSLGAILDPGHPIVEGVTALNYSGFVQNVGLAPGATAIANWSNGQLFLAANENVVALNMLPSLGNGGPLQWSGDLALIYQNAVHYLSGPGFVSVSPTEGTIAAGASLTLDVTFDATGLDAGVYEASINIGTNVPGHELVEVPAVLNVLGPEFTVNPTSLSEELQKNQTSTQIITLNNNGPDDQTFSVDVQGVGVGASATVKVLAVEPVQQMSTLRMSSSAPVADPQEKIAANANKGRGVDVSSTTALTDDGSAERQMMMAPMNRSFAPMSLMAVPEQASAVQYSTDFEDLAPGDINGQQGWIGQWGNWTVNSANPLSGSQHLRALSDGFGQSLAFSPDAPIGVEDKSTTSMRVNVQGTGVTWQIIPQSFSAGLVNTRIQFSPTGVMSALVTDGAGGASFQPIGTTPAGYFDLTLEFDRDSAYFTLSIDGADVFTGQGFTGNIEEVVFLSLMETAGPTLDIDDFSIIDGEKTQGVPFLDVSPTSGTIASGSSVQLIVTFNSSDLDFGTYNANINIHAGSTTLTVPASLRVFGAPQIDVDPTVLMATVDYKEDTVRHFTITNTGGNPLDYTLQVFGAETEAASLMPVAAKQLAPIDEETKAKLAKDERLSRKVEPGPTSVQMLAGTQILSQNFDGAAFPPTGWTVVDNAGSGLVWGFSADHDESNYSGTGEAATVSSDRAGTVEFDTELITPAISTAGYKNITVQYNANYQNYINSDFLDLDIQVDGGAWTTVLRWNEDHGAHRGTPGETVTAELGSYIGNGSTFRLRWHYYDPNSGDWDWYAQIDDVVVYGDARAWLTVSPAAGTIPVNGSELIEATFDAIDLEAGTYLATILLFSNAEVNPVFPVPALLNVRQPAVMTVTPEELYQELLKEVNEEATQTITIANSGASVLKYAFGNAPLPASATMSVPVPSAVRTTPSMEKVDLLNARALTPDGAEQTATALLATGFEDFSVGDINGQQGWVGQFGNWRVEADNAFEGAHHVQSVSDGLGATRAFSPLVAIGTDPISSVSLMVDPTETVTWQVIPQSPSAGFVNTRIQFGADGVLSALVSDGAGGAAYVPVPITLPSGYFELRVDVERATSEFTIFIDGTEVFTALGFAGNIEQIVLYSGMEILGPTWDIDNLVVYDGPAVAPWLTYNPKAGYVAPGSTATITVNFNSTELEPGVYSDTLSLSSNDPANSFVAIPVTLNVLYNTAPELAPIDTLEVIELSTTNVTFTATDVDGEPVTVELMDAPAFVTLVSSGDGTATYQVAPGLGDAGEYLITVQATDARFKHDSAFFHLFVIPYGVESFTLINTRNNQEIATFTDTLELDMNVPDLNKLTVRANTNPSSVGSVKFEYDGRKKNTDNSSPYLLQNNTLKDIDDGDDHHLEATAYTQKNAKGSEGQSLFAVIRMVNAAMVTDFDIVKPNGQKLGDLDDSTVIDISNPSFRLINVKANTQGGVVKSVLFHLNGHLFRVDNITPYQLGGLGTLIDLPLPALPGDYTVMATPYSEHYGQGIAGKSLTVSFSIVHGSRGTHAARERGDEVAGDDVIAETEAKSLGIYPVPVRDELNIELVETSEQFVSMTIMNAQGVQVYKDAGHANRFGSYKVDTNKLGLVRGVYFVHVQYADGRKEVRKFIKE